MGFCVKILTAADFHATISLLPPKCGKIGLVSPAFKRSIVEWRIPLSIRLVFLIIKACGNQVLKNLKQPPFTALNAGLLCLSGRGFFWSSLKGTNTSISVPTVPLRWAQRSIRTPPRLNSSPSRKKYKHSSPLYPSFRWKPESRSCKRKRSRY